MISFIEEEYDYQYSMIGIYHLKESCLVNDYENAIEEAMNYYSELDDESSGIPCPHCCSGILQEVGSQNTSCSKCGIKIPYSLNYIQNQLASIYQTHSCGKALSCNYNSNGSLFFFCNHCGFSTFFVYCCLLQFFSWSLALLWFQVISDVVLVCNITVCHWLQKMSMQVFLDSLLLKVNVVAYGGKKCCEEVESNKRITKYHIGDNPFNRLPRKLFLLYAPFKVLYQV